MLTRDKKWNLLLPKAESCRAGVERARRSSWQTAVHCTLRRCRGLRGTDGPSA